MTAMRAPAGPVARVVYVFAVLISAPGAAPAPAIHASEFGTHSSSTSDTQRVDTPLFSPVVTYDPAGSQASMVTIADLNADNKADVVVVNCGSCYVVRPGESVAVMLGNGDGTLQPAVAYATGGVTPLFVAVADLNHDEKPDLVVANRCGNNGCLNGALVGVLLGRGDGTFESAVTYDSGGLFASSVAIADVNGDGHADIAVANNCADADCNASVGVLLGRGDGIFQSVVTYLTGGVDAFAVTLADVDGDPTLDIVVVGCAPGGCLGRLSVLPGNPDGTFQPPVSFPTGGGRPSAVVAAEINGDGKTDLVVAHTQCCTPPSGGVGVFLGNGDGTFQTGVTYRSGAGGQGTAVAVADVNDDGAPDLLTTEQCAALNCLNQGVVDVLLGNGDGTFQIPLTFGAGGFLTNSIAVGDLNGDRGADLVVANQCADDSGDCQQASVGVLLHIAEIVDASPPVISISATPRRLWPPNGKTVPVIVSGTMTDSASGIDANSTIYGVIDEYGAVQPGGRIRLDASGHYSFAILLQASRHGNDSTGRRYTILVGARDNAGNSRTASSVVTVPHHVE